MCSKYTVHVSRKGDRNRNWEDLITENKSVLIFMPIFYSRFNSWLHTSRKLGTDQDLGFTSNRPVSYRGLPLSFPYSGPPIPKYRERNVIERMICWLKENRLIVTRFDRLAKSYAAMVSLDCSMRCLRHLFGQSLGVTHPANRLNDSTRGMVLLQTIKNIFARSADSFVP